MRLKAACCLAMALLSGCAAPYRASKSLPVDAAAYALMNESAAQSGAAEYEISPDDTLSINVFLEPDLSLASAKVSKSGNIAVPAIGTVKAIGLTTDQLADVIEGKLRGSLLRAPKVSVAVLASSRMKVVVVGEVNQPGVFDIRPDTTLLESVALGGGGTEISKIDEVVVFRTINGQRMAARFDVGAIMGGEQLDPKILPNDVVVVGYSATRSFWRNVRQTVPVIGLFRPLVQ